ncbi:hypothetical protein MMC25_005643 [Agyrium rufum]|nr:hypothetical protein [Agyrium rufum]
MPSQHSDNTEPEPEEFFVPLTDQRVFGAGTKRKRVTFVPAATTGENIANGKTRCENGVSAADLYASIALKPDAPIPDRKLSTPKDSSEPTSQTVNSELEEFGLCPICNLPLAVPFPSTHPHSALLTHQLSLPHSHPPSALSRTTVGAKYLSSYGWDPDSRLGLGARGEGRREPIKVKIKNDTLGLGTTVPVDKRSEEEKQRDKMKGKLVDAKKVRGLEGKGKRKAEKLREMFYGSEEVEKYLGGG